MYDEAKNYWFLSNKQFYADRLIYGYGLNNYKWIDENNMSNVSHVLDALLDEDTRALVDAGFLDGSLRITDAGRAEINKCLYEQNKHTLVAVAKEQLAKAKK